MGTVYHKLMTLVHLPGKGSVSAKEAPTYAEVPHSLLAAHLGRPPGLLADIGGTLAGTVDDLQRLGWIVHLACEHHDVIKTAARNGARAAMRSSPREVPFAGKHYDAVVMALPGEEDAAPAMGELRRICRPGAKVVVTTTIHNNEAAVRNILSMAGMQGIAVYVDEGDSVSLHIGQSGPLLAVAQCP